MGTNPPAPPDDQKSFLERFWPHLTIAAGAFIAIGLGAADHFAAKDAWGVAADISFIWAGLGALGVTAVAAVKSA